MPDDLIKKSIRLPADLDEYVNSQKGTTWTDKLCRILEDYRSGDETRADIWQTMKSAWQPTGKRSRSRIVRSILSLGHWITCTVPLKI